MPTKQQTATPCKHQSKSTCQIMDAYNGSQAPSVNFLGTLPESNAFTRQRNTKHATSSKLYGE